MDVNKWDRGHPYAWRTSVRLRDLRGVRSVTTATAVSVALCATATAVRAQDGATSPSYSVRAAIGHEGAWLAAAGARSTTWQQPVPPGRNWVEGHPVAGGFLIRTAADTTLPQQTLEQERSWVARHPALTGALIGAGVGATYAYIKCRGACEGQPGLYMMLFGGIGAGIGAGTGAIVGALRH
jgi:hypothetical protein